MDKYLLQILLEVNTIIIPGLGAFTVVNKEKNEIMFMSYLKHDDGKLVKHIVTKDGLTENDARNLVSKYVRDILLQLDKGDTYDMFKFGRFFKENGEIQFEAWEAYNKPTSDKNTNEHHSSESNTKKQEVKLESKPVIKEMKTEDSSIGSKNEEKRKDTPTDSVIPVEEKVKTKEEKVIQEQETTSNQNIEQNIQKPKSNFKIIIGIGIGVIALISSIIFFSINNKTESNNSEVAKLDENTTKAVEEIENQVSIDNKIDSTIETTKVLEPEKKLVNEEKKNPKKETIKKETIKKVVKKEVKKTEKVIPNKTEKQIPEKNKKTTVKELKQGSTTQTTHSVGGKYHIIIGSFGVEANAKRLVAKSIKEGNNSKLLGKINGVYVVSLNSYPTSKEAIAAMNSTKIKGYVMRHDGE